MKFRVQTASFTSAAPEDEEEKAVVVAESDSWTMSEEEWVKAVATQEEYVYRTYALKTGDALFWN